MFSGGNFPVKIEIQKSVSEFASCYGMPDVGAAACARRHRLAPAGTRRHRLAGRPGWLDRPPATDRPHGHGLRTRPRPRTAPARPHGHGRTRTDTASRPPWRRGEAPARLRPFVNKKAGNPQGKPARESGRLLSAAAGWDCTGPEETDKPRTDLWNHAPPSLSHQL